MGKKHKVWESRDGKKRRGELVNELNRFNSNVPVADRAEKYRRMSLSPFAFYRGSAHVFYMDLASIKMPWNSDFHSEKSNTWILGDLHIGNFGIFDDGTNHVVFDVNDFDEAWVSSYLFDVWRGACSLALSARENGFDQKQIKAFLIEFVDEYLALLEKYIDTDEADFKRVRVENSHGPLKKFLLKAEKKKSRKSMLDDWTVKEDGQRRFDLSNKRLAVISHEDSRIIASAISLYKDTLTSDVHGNEKYFRVIDSARRLGAGVGSLGTPRYYVLIRGTSKDPDDGVILDVKQQDLPSSFPFLPYPEQEKLMGWYDENHSGNRVAEAQKALLKYPDQHLGAITVLERSFSVRERSPFKKSLKIEKLTDYQDFHDMAHHWGTILATAHARADIYNHQMVPHSFELEVTKITRDRRETFRDEVMAFAIGYADQVSEDFEIFRTLLEKDGLH